MKKLFLNEREMLSLLDHLEWSTTRHAMIIELLAHTGMRCHELWDLKVEHINFERNTLTLWDAAKGSDGRFWELPAGYVTRISSRVMQEGFTPDTKLIEVLGYDARGGNAETFKSLLRRDWLVIRKRVFGILKLGLHALRHSFCVHFYKASGNDIVATQRAMGHKSIQSTMRYLSQFDETKHLSVTANLYSNLRR